MEEKKFNEEKIKDLISKEKQEEAHVLRQESIITMMEGQIESLTKEIDNYVVDEENKKL